MVSMSGDYDGDSASANRNGPTSQARNALEMGGKQNRHGQRENSGDGASNRFAGIQDDAVQDTPAERAAGLATVKAEVEPVFFMIGCQRSGSNWLRTMLGEREDLIAPHPPHIMRDFSPLLGKYGDLNKQPNLKVGEVVSVVSISHSLNQL